MIDWTARAKSEISQALSTPTTETPGTAVMGVLGVGVERVCRKNELACLDRRRERIRRWLSKAEAELLAERLALRDLEQDDRRMCVECLHCRSDLACNAYRAAGVGRELGRDLATLLQRCPAFVPSAGIP